MGPFLVALNKLPRRLGQSIFGWSGWLEAVPSRRFRQIDGESLSRWICGHYPRRRYPALMVGSAGGSVVHLAAALGVPWLPQTLLLPVRQTHVDPDDVMGSFHSGRQRAEPLLQSNPNFQLHHLHDPIQDRLMLRGMGHFRLKWRRLSDAYQRFIQQTLTPGGTLLVVECQKRWPVTRVSDRHLFQVGGLGGAEPEEIRRGSPRIRAFLASEGSTKEHWSLPPWDDEAAEAEWGFEAALGDDLRSFARRHGFRLRRLVYKEPVDLSALVADLYRHWYRQRRMVANRLYVETFMMHEPWWTLRTGSVPFWMPFSVEDSLRALESYMDQTDPYDHVLLTLFSHGMKSIGVPDMSAWKRALARARVRGQLLGTTERFPFDFASLHRYHTHIPKTIPARYPLPPSLTWKQLDAFLDRNGSRYPVHWSA